MSTRRTSPAFRADVSQRRTRLVRDAATCLAAFHVEYGITPLVNGTVTGLTSLPIIPRLAFTKYGYLLMEHGLVDHWRFTLVPLAAEYLATGVRPTDPASRAIEAMVRDWVSSWEQRDHPDDAAPVVEELYWTTVDRLRATWAEVERLVQFAEIQGTLSADDVWELLHPTGFAARHATAMHEAGHAVVAYVLGCPPWYLSIIPADGYLGVCCNHPPVAGSETPDMEVAISAAGPLAEERVTGVAHDGEEIAEALRRADRWAHHAGVPVPQRQRLEQLAVAVATAILDASWPAVAALATSLLERPTLVHKSVHDIIEAALIEAGIPLPGWTATHPPVPWRFEPYRLRS